MVLARYYDGRLARPHAASARLEADHLLLDTPGGPGLARWPLARLRGRLDTGPDDILVVFLPDDPARAILDDPDLAADLRRRCPDLFRPTPDPAVRRRAWLLGTGALAALALMVFGLLPVLANRLAPLIPAEREAALGRVVVGQVTTFFGVEDAEQPFCDAPAGLRALDRLAARLTAAVPLPYPEISLQVVDGGAVNAFAAPGGQVVVFRGLIEGAAGPDELAGVLAHEFGHVAARDPTRLALRSAGTAGLLGLLFGDFTGGTVVLALGNRLIQSSYTRQAEAGADVFALRMLAGAGISPDGLGDFFDRMQAETGGRSDLGNLLASHPDLGRRADAARAAPAGGATRPALSAADWAALKAICD
jgi:Zn-dependent protease with chaperone function